MQSTRNDNVVRYEEAREGGELVFSGSFSLAADPDRVLQVLFDPDHLVRFMTIPSSVEILERGDEWQRVAYRYHAFLVPMRAVFVRTLKRADRRIDFEMQENRPQLPLLPRVASYRGHYQLEPRVNDCHVEYHQRLSVSPWPAALLLARRSRRDLVSFLQSTKLYLAELCGGVRREPAAGSEAQGGE